MKSVSVFVVAAAASTLVLSAATWRADPPGADDESRTRREVTRLRAHFDSVDAELRARDVSHLSAAQRANRAQLIGWLKEYRDAGRFPINDRFAGQYVPFFRDSKGTLCAMAYLVDRSGGGDIVDHIARTRNNAFIRELTDDRRLVAWLDASGLSVSEAARIQPAYDGGGCCVIDDPAQDRVSGDYALVSMGLSGSSVGTLGFNLFRPSRASGVAGIMAGMATVLAGASRMGDVDGDRKVARANAAVGSLALIGGLRGFFVKPAARDRAPAQVTSHSKLSVTAISPDVVFTSSAPRIGLRLQAEF